jgi:hypothetical protein
MLPGFAEVFFSGVNRSWVVLTLLVLGTDRVLSRFRLGNGRDFSGLPRRTKRSSQ